MGARELGRCRKSPACTCTLPQPATLVDLPAPALPCSFAVELEYWGEVREVELKPGGAHIPVTADNREVGGGGAGWGRLQAIKTTA